MSGPASQRSKPSRPTGVVRRLEEAVYARRTPQVVAGVVGCATVVYLTGHLSEAIEGMLLGGGVVLLSAGWLLRELLARSAGRAGKIAALAIAGGVLLVSLGPMAVTLAPRQPLVTGAFTEPGQAVGLPPEAAGLCRLLVHGAIAGHEGDARVTFAFAAGGEQIRGELERQMVSVRMGRGGRSQTAHDHDTVFVSGRLPAGAQKLELTRLSGPLSGPLELQIFRPWLGFWHWALLALGAAASVVWQQLRRRLDLKATFAGCWALMFGLAVYSWATPAAAVGPEIGAFLVAGIGAAVAMVAVAKLAAAFHPAHDQSS